MYKTCKRHVYSVMHMYTECTNVYYADTCKRHVYSVIHMYTECTNVYYADYMYKTCTVHAYYARSVKGVYIIVLSICMEDVWDNMNEACSYVLADGPVCS